MTESRSFSHVFAHSAMQYLSLLLLVPSLFLLAWHCGVVGNPQLIQNMEWLVILVAALHLWRAGRTQDEETIERQELLFFVLLGLTLRIGYMLAMPATHYQHDIGSVPGEGHAAYIMYLLQNHAMPPSNAGQFYHPPLFHALAALNIAVLQPFQHPQNTAQMLEAAKIVPCLASCATLLIFVSLCRECGLRRRFQIPAVALLALFPSFIIVSGRINNDSLVTMFIMLCLLFTLRWYRRPDWGNTLALALAFGLGVMTKLSGALPALLAGPVMLYRWRVAIRNQNGWRIFLQLLLFAVASLPLGLWHPIHNLLLFGQPLGYVVAPGGTDSLLYCGNHSFSQRFLAIQIWELAERPFCIPAGDWNLPLYLIRCPVFGEFAWNMPLPLAKLLTFVNALLIAMSLCSVLFLPFTVLFRKRRSALLAQNRTGNATLPVELFIPACFILFVASHVLFNIRFPFGCTMDFRYIMICAVAGILSLCLSLQWLDENGECRAWKAAMPPITLFCILSAILYTHLSI